MKKPWSGRFTEETSRIVEHYTESISYDRRLWRYDIEGSIAHARMLGRQGIIPEADAGLIVQGLQDIARDIEEGAFTFREDLEDVHMNIEAALIERIGEPGERLHTARSRNDQVALDLRLYLRDEVQTIRSLLRTVEGALLERSEEHLGVIMPGYTHSQRAQPVLLSHHLMAYAQMLERDRARFRDLLGRINVLPLGSCALAGTSLPIDRGYVAELLGFGGVSENSMDSVADRDFAVEFLSCAAILMMHISRIAEEMVRWSSEEFRFVELRDAFTTGSSIMPQKKNPDVAELMRGKTGRVYGSLMSLLTTMKGLPLTYNRDMQEDKEPVFDTADTVRNTLTLLAELIGGVRFNAAMMESGSDAGYATATDIAEYFVRKGVPFRRAHEITGRIVRSCIDGKKALRDLTLQEYRSFSDAADSDIFEVLDAAASVRMKRSYGGTAPEAVRGQIERFKKAIGGD
jgi:argininosuccinate lyase